MKSRFSKCNDLFFLFALLLSFLSIPSPANADSLDRFKLNGYMDLEYTKSNNDQGNESGSFDQRHFNLLMKAAINERLSVKGHIEFEHGASTQSNFGTVQVEWAFIEYVYDDFLKLRGGKLLTPYGFYNEIRDATPALIFINVPKSIYNAEQIGGIAIMPKWNTGLNVLGEHFFSEDFSIDYNFYIGNGESLSTTNEAQFDDNTDKAFGGRIQVHPTFNSTIGFSAFHGDKAITAASDIPHTAYGVSGAFDMENFNVAGEYFLSKLSGNDAKGYYVQASYSFHDRFTPYLVYSYLDPDADVSNDQWESIAGGINVKLMEGLFFKMEYHKNQRGSNNSEVTNGRNDFDEVKAAITVAF